MYNIASCHPTVLDKCYLCLLKVLTGELIHLSENLKTIIKTYNWHKMHKSFVDG